MEFIQTNLLTTQVVESIREKKEESHESLIHHLKALLRDYKTRQAEIVEQMARHEKADENFYITAYMVVAPISHLSAIELHCHKEIAGIDNMMKFFKSPYINRTVKINNNLLHDTNLLTYQFS